jgi:hypothetical protein
MLFVFVALSFLGPAVPSLQADGGIIRLSERRGRYHLTVFTQPTPCRVGSVDISVLVQDAATGKPLTAADVTIQLELAQGPRHTLRATATTDAATNKLLFAAAFDVPNAGRWQGEVRLTHEAESVTSVFAFEVEEALPTWRSFGLWIAAPLVGIVLFAVHQVLVGKRKTGSAAGA